MSTNQSIKIFVYILFVVSAFVLAGCSASPLPEPTVTTLPTTVPTLTASPIPTDTSEPTATATETTSPTDTPVPTETATPTPEPSAFTVDELLISQSPWEPDPVYEACGIGPVSLFCPKDWFALENERQAAYVSSEALLEGFKSDTQGGQLQISLFSVFDLQVAAPEDVLPGFMESVFPGEASREIIDGPVVFSLNGQDAAALTLRYDDKEPAIVALMIAVQQNGRIVTIVANTSLDVSDQLLPVMAKGITALEVDIEARSHYLLPQGNTSGTMSRLDGSSPGSIPIYTNSDQMVFVFIDPLPSEVDVQLELVDPNTHRVIASSDRDGKEYIFYHFDQAGQYELVIRSGQPGSYVTWLIVPQGVAAAAYAGSNEFSSRLDADSSLSYVLLINSGEVVDISVIPDDATLDLVVSVFSVSDGTQLVAIDDVGAGDTEAFTFEPPQAELHLIVVEEKNGSAGTFTVFVDYR